MPSTDDSGWIQLKIKTSYGSNSPFGAFRYKDSVMIPAMENDVFVGFASILGQNVEPSTTLFTVGATGSDLMSNPLEPDMLDVVSNMTSEITSIVYKNKAYIALTKSSGSINNRVYVFDFGFDNVAKKQKYAWSPWDGINVRYFCVYNGTLYYADADSNGFVYEMNTTTYSDNGAAINSFYYTKEFGGRPGDENFVKDWRWLYLLYRYTGQYSLDINLLVDSDSEVGTTYKKYMTDTSIYLWDNCLWDDGIWSSSKVNNEAKISLGGLRGKSLQFKFSNGNTAGQRFKLMGLTLDYNLRGRR